MSEWEIVEEITGNASIKVVGVGGGGGNAVQHMVDVGIEGANFISVNTDKQALDKNGAGTKLVLGMEITDGLGAGANPQVGREAALEDRDKLREMLKGTDMVFVTAGMGGGTGTGAAPIVAQVAKELGILTVAVVTKPFELEGSKRMKIAQEGIKELIEEVDSLITIPNQKLLEVLGEDCSMLEAFKQANDVLAGAVRGISDIIIKPGLINVDFADVKTVMSEKGTAMMGTGTASGPDRARIAAEHAVASKLLEDISLQDAKGVLVNITAGPELSLGEIKAVGDCISDFASEEAIIVTGTVLDDTRGNDLIVTVIATGLSSSLQTISKPSGQVNMLNDRKPLPLSDAARKMLENPPKVEKIKEKSKDEEDYLDIPSFVRTQLD
ncbi:MAG: cell division protein FtsZ [SAR86 cluster bacterium]|jgi:cell division protein FtsZ|nr:cell division protein FtsZ [Gammaproteobacteria bacterium]MDG2456833.1 cell division protein FtsZ [SAR86 cluster bacterium]